MRGANFPVLVFPLLLAHCGSKQDLIIGELARVSEAGTAGTSMTGMGAEAGTAGSEPGGSGGLGGTTDAGGSSEGGTAAVAGSAGAAGSAGVAGSGGDDCVDGVGPPVGSLIHRYSFDGTGATVTDIISGDDGTLEDDATLDGTGFLTLEGSPTRQHVDLPDGLISSLTDMTVVVWMTWGGGAAWQRVFDFGISNSGESQGTQGTSYVAVMTETGFDDQQSPGLGAEIKAPGHPTIQLASKEDMDNREAQVGFVFRSGVNAELFLDATQLANVPTEITLADIDDRNNWIGQSQWSVNGNLDGTIDEFRIYDVALDACQINTLLVRGRDMPD